MKKLNDDIVKAGKLLPKLSRRGGGGDGKDPDPIAVLAEEIEGLEFHRSTSSLGLSEEKDLVRRMAALKKQQQQFTEFAGLKAERKQLNDDLDRLVGLRAELREGAKAYLIAEKVRALRPDAVFALTDIVTEVVTVASALVGRIVGKGGASRVAIEQECGVLIDIIDNKEDKTSAGVRLTGLAAGIAAAKTKIDDLGSYEEETLDVEVGLASLLLSRSGSGVKQLEADTGVRAQVSRAEHRITLFGPARVLAEAKSWLATVQDSRVIMSVPVAILPAVIGTAGANFKRIQDTHGVEIDVKRPDGAEPTADFTLTVWGVEPAALEGARGELLHIISASTKHTVAVELDPSMVGFWVSNNGERVKAFQKAHNVFANVRRVGGPRAAAEDVVVPEGAAAWMEIKGVRAAIDAAIADFNETVKAYDRTNLRIPLSAAQGRTLLGKGGDGIKKLRAELDVTIEIEIGGAAPYGKASEADAKRRGQNMYDLPAGKAIIVLRSEDVDKLEAARVAVMSIADAFKTVEYKVPDATIGALIKKGGEVVSKLTSETGATVDIDRAALTVTLSGVDTAVAAASAVIEDLIASNYSVTVDIDDPDMIGGILGKKGENIRKLQVRPWRPMRMGEGVWM